jgi:bifunctional DNA-binding transcriptional regulator/antitoxin component of YhaV-PrlF toxin-antitoxin module
MTVADDIRALAAQGLRRAEIARRLGKSYQHVRNVLEGDKLRAAARSTQTDEASPGPGVAEPSATFGRTLRLNVEEGGVVRLPPEMRSVLGARDGGVLIVELGEDRATILSGRAAMAKIQAMVSSLNIDPNRVLSEELIAERRAENLRDSQDD